MGSAYRCFQCETLVPAGAAHNCITDRAELDHGNVGVEARFAFGEELFRAAAINGNHPQIFLCGVIGHVIGATQVRSGGDAALGMARSVRGLADDIIRGIERRGR